MAPVALPVIPSPFVGRRQEPFNSGLPIRGHHIPLGWGDGLPLTTAHVDLVNARSTGVSFLPSIFGSNGHPWGRLSGASSIQPVGDSSRTTPQSVDSTLGTSPVSNALARGGSESALQRRVAWRGFFSSGCLSSADMHAERLVSCTPWTDRSTVGLLAELFREQYSKVLTCPWAENLATSRVITFLKATDKLLCKKGGMLVLLEFRTGVREVALDGFHLSVNLNDISTILKRSCYLRALFHLGLVCEDDIVYALARVAQLANCIEYFQVFYLLTQAIVDPESHACVIQEIRKHLRMLGDTLNKCDEPDGCLLWCYLTMKLIGPCLTHVNPRIQQGSHILV